MFNLGLPNVVVSGLAINAQTGKLIAGTYGRGVYQTDLKPAQSAGPSLYSRGVLNAFSFDTALSPGMIASAFGTRLTGGNTADAGGSPQATLAGTSVTVNGIAAPLFFASPAQLNFQVPFEISGTAALVVVSTPEGASASTSVLMPASPGILNGSVMHSNGVRVDESSPAATGEVVVLYATGLGITKPPTATGTAAPSDPLAYAAAPVAAIFGSTPGTVWFAGLAPGFTGLYQVNVQVPSGLAPGKVALALTAAGRLSNVVAVTVQ